MTSKDFLSLLTLLLAFTACDAKKDAQNDSPVSVTRSTDDAVAKVEPTISNIKTFGSELSLEELTPLQDVFLSPESFKDKLVLVEGYVQRACTKKGCWMEIALDENKAAQRCRVKFQDYAFFVPKDSAGSNAKVQGKIQVNIVSKERVDHLEAEGARFAHKQTDGTALEVQIVATGVELTKSS